MAGCRLPSYREPKRQLSQEPTTAPAAAFLARHADTDFPHREELLALLATGVSLEGGSSDGSASELLETYRRRVAHLASLLARLGENVDPILREDVYPGAVELVAALENASTSRVRVFYAIATDGRFFTVFEDVETDRIFTCIKGLDQRIRAYGGLSE